MEGHHRNNDLEKSAAWPANSTTQLHLDGATPHIAWVFSGLGTTWPAMGRELWLHDPVFRRSIEKSSTCWEAAGGWSLVEEWERPAEESRLAQTAIGHPALVAFQIALTDWLHAHGFPCHGVVGHSLGEVAAAYAAGVLDRSDAFAVVRCQVDLIDRVRGRGGLLYLGEPAEGIPAEFRETIDLAASNSRFGCVWSGPNAALEKLRQEREAAGIFTRLLALDFPAHGRMIAAQASKVDLPGIEARSCTVPIYSSLFVAAVESGGFEAGYWPKQLSRQVRFDATLDCMLADGYNSFVEIGPHPALIRDIGDALDRNAVDRYLILETIHEGDQAADQLAFLLAMARQHGLSIEDSNWPATLRKRVDVFQKTKTEAAQPPGDLRQLIRRTFQDVMGWKEDRLPDSRLGFMAQGMNSLLSVQFIERLRRSLGLRLPVTLLFDCPNPEALRAYLQQRLGVEQLESSTVESMDREALMQQLQDWLGKNGASEDRLRLLLRSIREQDRVTDRVAVVGMACRMPGGANDLDSYWRLLSEGRDGTSDIPADRWNNSAFYSADPSAPGKSVIRRGGFLQGTDPYAFDPAFFRISPAEALAMDPQQRLLLECVVEAFEHAGIPLEELRGKNVGTFLGICSDDYKAAHFYSGETENIDAYSLLGTVFSAASGRIAFTFGFQGPTISVDTACSSSLVALHLASKALRNGECDIAVVGGVNLLLAPNGFIYFSKLRAGSPDGTCRPFDAAANGYARGEGCGIVVLQRESDALEAEHRVLGFVRGTATNQDGASSGFTVPNGLAQQDLIRRTLNDANLQAEDISYVETHGTGTPLGDPIEVNALSEVYGQAATADHPLIIGSVKSNIGHLEGAAGISGILKVLLAMQHRTLPGTIHLKDPNPDIDWARLPLAVPGELHPWSGSNGENRPRIAAISGFGFSGSNAHVILEEGPAEGAKPADDQEPPHLLLLSAKDAKALRAQAVQYADFLNEHSDQLMSDIAYTAAVGRSHYAHRLAVTAADREEAIEALTAFAAGEIHSACQAGIAAAEEPARIAFLFTGQGAQYYGMGRELNAKHPLFREELDRCNHILRELDEVGAGGAEDLIDLLYGETDPETVHQTAWSQPALFALEYALAQLWISWGIEPAAVAGHSVGEYVAAVIAGCMTLEDGLRLIARRGRLMQELAEGGGMAVVFAPTASLESWLAQKNAAWSGRIQLAAQNTPDANTVAGEIPALEAFATHVQAQGVKCRMLKVSHAFHSHLMDPMLEAFRQEAEGINYGDPQIPLVANRDGKALSSGTLDAEYWVQHVRGTVRFEDCLHGLQDMGIDTFLEIGPDVTLSALGRKSLGDPDLRWLSSLRRKRSDWTQLQETLAAAYTQGIEIDWQGYFAPWSGRMTSLPTYPFQRERYFQDPAAAASGRPSARSGGGLRLPLLGAQVDTPIAGRLYAQTISLQDQDMLGDHIMHQLYVLPGTAYLEMGIAAARALHPRAASVSIADVSLREAMVLAEQAPRDMQSVIQERGGKPRLQIHSRLADGREQRWKLHADMRLDASDRPPRLQRFRFQPDKTAEQLPRRASGEDFYSMTETLGYGYANEFRCIRWIAWSEQGAVSEVDCGKAKAEHRGYQFHPGLLDSCLQVFIATNIGLQDPADVDRMIVPVYFESLVVYRPLTGIVHVHFEITEPGEEIRKGALSIQNEEGEVLARVEGLTGQLVSRRQLQRQARNDLSGYMWAVDWKREKARQVAAGMVGTGQEAPALVLTGEHPFHAELLPKLAVNRQVYQLEADLDLQAIEREEDRFRVNPLDAEAMREVLQLITDEAGSLGLVIQGWAMDFEGVEDLETSNAVLLGGTLHLTQALTQTGQQPDFFLLTTRARNLEGDEFNVCAPQVPLHALGNVIELEYANMSCVRVDLGEADFAELNQLLMEIRSVEQGQRLAYRGKERYTARFVHWRDRDQEEVLPIPERSNFELATSESGLLENLHYRPVDTMPLNADEVRIQVHATGLNFRDVLSALGQYPGDAGAFGLECAGLVTEVGPAVTRLHAGHRVMAQVRGAFRREVTVRVNNAVVLPDDLSFEDAVTIPGPYLTAWYGLIRLGGGIKPGERILIHAGAGGVGMAAIHIARAMGAEIHATASKGKQDFLRELGVEHIYNSRSLAFAGEVMEATNGEGVDWVLNALAGPAIEKSFGLLRDGGLFIEMGKKGIWTPQQAAEFNPSLHYHAFDLAEDAAADSELIPGLFAELMPWVGDGRLPLLPKTVFPIERTTDAFRFMAQARHIGKIVISQSHRVRKERFMERGIVEPGATYLLSGGLGALGSLFTDWLIGQGATHFAMLNRSEPNERQRERMAGWKEAGADVRVYACDVADREDFASTMARITADLPPIKGVIHCAGVLDDAMIASTDWTRFDKVLRPKVQGAWYLHELTGHMDLDFFVCFSSVAAVFGNRGQANYASANYFLDGLIQYRRRQGLPASCVNWGPWGEAGMAAADAKKAVIMAEQGFVNLQTDMGLSMMERLLEEDLGQVAFADLNLSRFLPTMPPSARATFFDDLLSQVSIAGEEEEVAEDSDFWAELARVSPDQHGGVMREFIKQAVAGVLKIRSAADIDEDKPFREMGFDSLTNAEFVNRMDKTLQVGLPQSIYMDAPTVSSMAKLLLSMPDIAAKIGQERDHVLEEELPVADQVVEAATAEMVKPSEDIAMEKTDEQLSVTKQTDQLLEEQLSKPEAKGDSDKDRRSIWKRFMDSLQDIES